MQLEIPGRKIAQGDAGRLHPLALVSVYKAPSWGHHPSVFQAGFWFSSFPHWQRTRGNTVNTRWPAKEVN